MSMSSKFQTFTTRMSFSLLLTCVSIGDAHALKITLKATEAEATTARREALMANMPLRARNAAHAHSASLAQDQVRDERSAGDMGIVQSASGPSSAVQNGASYQGVDPQTSALASQQTIYGAHPFPVNPRSMELTRGDRQAQENGMGALQTSAAARVDHQPSVQPPAATAGASHIFNPPVYYDEDDELRAALAESEEIAALAAAAASEECLKQDEIELLLAENIINEDRDERFFCPISMNLMCDPVTADDGVTYERSQITKWLNSAGFDNLSVVTRTPLERSTTLTPNEEIKREILGLKDLAKVIISSLA